MLRATAIAVIAAAASLVGAAAADAHGEVGTSGATVTYSAIDDPTVNTVTVSKCGARCLQLADSTVDPGMDPGPCSAAGGNDPRVVSCPWKRGARIRMKLGALDDRAEIDVAVPAELHGGSGNDTLIGGSRSDTLIGDSGTDTFNGRGGNDVIVSTDGTAENVNCGAGFDTADADAEDTLKGCENFTKVADLNAAAPVLKLDVQGRFARVWSSIAGSLSLSGSGIKPVKTSITAKHWTRVQLSTKTSRRVTVVAVTSDGAGNAAQTTRTGISVRR